MLECALVVFIDQCIDVLAAFVEIGQQRGNRRIEVADQRSPLLITGYFSCAPRLDSAAYTAAPANSTKA